MKGLKSSTIGKEILEVLKGSGCELAWFNPVFQTTFGKFNHRNHRKSLIIDGRVAYTGGAGIADHWRGCAQDPDHWRDIQVRVEGPAATVLQTGFTHNWLITTGEEKPALGHMRSSLTMLVAGRANALHVVFDGRVSIPKGPGTEKLLSHEAASEARRLSPRNEGKRIE